MPATKQWYMTDERFVTSIELFILIDCKIRQDAEMSFASAICGQCRGMTFSMAQIAEILPK